MLVELSIENVAIIDKVTLELGEGLTVLSGETGAGKSIIIDAVKLILGVRAEKGLVRVGQQAAQVQAQIDISGLAQVKARLDELEIECGDDTLVVVRKIWENGRSSCRINGEMVTLSQLRSIMQGVIDIHGQHGYQALLDPQCHMDILDEFAGRQAAQLKENIENIAADYRQIVKKRDDLFGDEAERARRIDMLDFQIAEIGQAKLQVGEQAELTEQRRIIERGESITKSLSDAYSWIYDGAGGASALELVENAALSLEKVSELDAQLASAAEQLNGIKYELEDVAHYLGGAVSNYDFEPGLLEQTDDRIAEIKRITRKYGGDEQAALKFYEEAVAERDRLEHSAELAEQLAGELEGLKACYLEADRELGKVRRKAGERLAAAIMEQLSHLGMKDAEFAVQFSSARQEVSAKGSEDAQFMINVNKGGKLSELSKVASGGEMSRIMLALKNVTADIENIPTLIFDEIDTGISGHISQVVANKLADIALGRQVICVTHSAAIAAMADNSYLVKKSSDDVATHTQTLPLEREGRIAEVARLAGGADISAVSYEHAGSIVAWCENYKQNLREKRL